MTEPTISSLDSEQLAKLKAKIKHDGRFGVTSFPRDLSNLFAHIHEDFACRQQQIEWTLDHWAETELLEYVPVVDEVWAMLDGKSRVWTNDQDSTSFTVKLPGLKAFATEDQNSNYLFHRTEEGLLDLLPGLVIYRYWKKPSRRWEDDEVSLRQLSKQIKEGGWKNSSTRGSWVAALPRWPSTGCDRIIYKYRDFCHALFCLSCLHRELSE